ACWSWPAAWCGRPTARRNEGGRRLTQRHEGLATLRRSVAAQRFCAASLTPWRLCVSLPLFGPRRASRLAQACRHGPSVRGNVDAYQFTDRALGEVFQVEAKAFRLGRVVAFEDEAACLVVHRFVFKDRADIFDGVESDALVDEVRERFFLRGPFSRTGSRR